MEGSTVLTSVVAQTYRADLKSAGTGTGNYGFSIALPLSLKNGQARKLSLRVKGSTLLLTNSPRSVTCSAPPEYEGAFEAASCTEIKGWAWKKNYPDAAAMPIEIMEGNIVVASTTAGIYREDLVSDGKGTGKYGFSIALPASLRDGQSHQLSARLKGTTFVLPGSPKSLNCSSTARVSMFNTLEAESATYNDFDLLVAPNPTSGSVVANFHLSKGEHAAMKIFDSAGHTLWKKEVLGTGMSHQEKIDLTQQIDGIYLLQVSTNNHTTIKRIVLVK
jgi:hypothetical protein